MTSDDDWTWKFTPRAADQFDSLDPHVQDRIVSKLDEVVESEWRDPDECILDRSGSVLEVHRVEHRSGAYTADDD